MKNKRKIGKTKENAEQSEKMNYGGKKGNKEDKGKNKGTT